MTYVLNKALMKLVTEYILKWHIVLRLSKYVFTLYRVNYGIVKKPGISGENHKNSTSELTNIFCFRIYTIWVRTKGVRNTGIHEYARQNTRPPRPLTFPGVKVHKLIIVFSVNTVVEKLTPLLTSWEYLYAKKGTRF